MQSKRVPASTITVGMVIDSCDGKATVHTVQRFGDKVTILSRVGKREIKIKTWLADLIPVFK